YVTRPMHFRISAGGLKPCAGHPNPFSRMRRALRIANEGGLCSEPMPSPLAKHTLAFLKIVAVSLISTATVFAQSTNRQIGTQFTVTADPLVPRPHEQPCVVPLFANYQFAHFSESVQTFAFTPPGNCSGP